MTAPTVDRPLESAVLDEAHLGDIEAAMGSLSWRQLWPPRTSRRRLAALAIVAGPGLMAMVADNDAGGIATYAQVGASQGPRLLWVLALLGPVLFVNQEMAARLGAVTGVGHARLIIERFGRFWGAFSVGDLLVLNALTLLTEFVGIRLACDHLGISPLVAVPGAALVLLWATATGSFRHWERVMYMLIAVDVAAIPLLLAAHPPALDAGARGGAPGEPAVLLIVALAGTTVAPWQLFFQQSVVVDKRITPRWLRYERADTAIGAALMLTGAVVVMLVASAAFAGVAPAAFPDVGAIAGAVSDRFGSMSGGLLAILVLDGAILGAAAVTLATSYAIGDVAGARHSLHRTPTEAPLFHGVFALLIAVAAAVAMLPGLPLGTITTLVQVLAGLLLPSATVFLLLLCNDPAVLGPWVNGRWTNAVASSIIAALLVLSALLVVTTLFPAARLDVVVPLLATIGLAGLAVTAAVTRRCAPFKHPADAPSVPALRVLHPSALVVRVASPGSQRRLDRALWRMPRLDELRRPTMSRGRLVGMIALRAYLCLSVFLLAARLAATALGH